MQSRVLQDPVRALIEPERTKLQALRVRMENAYRVQNTRDRLSLNVWREKLHALDPAGVLNRGYAAVYSGGKVVESTAAVQSGMKLRVRLADGSFGAIVTDVAPDKDDNN